MKTITKFLLASIVLLSGTTLFAQAASMTNAESNYCTVGSDQQLRSSRINFYLLNTSTVAELSKKNSGEASKDSSWKKTIEGAALIASLLTGVEESERNSAERNIQTRRHELSLEDTYNHVTPLTTQEQETLAAAEKAIATWNGAHIVALAREEHDQAKATAHAREAEQAKCYWLEKITVSHPAVDRACRMAIEQAEQAEHVWNARSKKIAANNNKLSLTYTKDKENAGKEEEAVYAWASLEPHERRAKLIDGEKIGNYEAADDLWNQAKAAWVNKPATRWAAENQQKILEEIAQVLAKEKSELANKDLSKTTLGKISSAAQKATSVLQYVGIAGMSPAAITKTTAIITDVINRKMAKETMKAAARAVESDTQIANELLLRAQQAEKMAFETEGKARQTEETAREEVISASKQSAEKLQVHFETSHLSSENNRQSMAARIAAIKRIDPIWESALSVWKERMRQSDQLVADLEHKASENKKTSSEFYNKAREARTQANADAVNVQQAENIKKNLESTYARSTQELQKLENEYNNKKADKDSAEWVMLKKALERKQQECTTNHNDDALEEAERNLEVAKKKADASEQKAVALEKEAAIKHDTDCDEEKIALRNINRAKVRAYADKKAYMALWPHEAYQEGLADVILKLDTTVLPHHLEVGTKMGVTVQSPFQQMMQLNRTISEETSHLVQSPLPQEKGSERLQMGDAVVIAELPSIQDNNNGSKTVSSQEFSDTNDKKQTMQLNRTINEDASHLVQSPLPQKGGAERLKPRIVARENKGTKTALNQKLDDQFHIETLASLATKMTKQMQSILSRLGFNDEGERLVEDSSDLMNEEELSLLSAVGNTPEARAFKGIEDKEMRDALTDQKNRTIKALAAYRDFMAGKAATSDSKKDSKSGAVLNPISSERDKIKQDLTSQIRNAYTTIQHAYLLIDLERERDRAVEDALSENIRISAGTVSNETSGNQDMAKAGRIRMLASVATKMTKQMKSVLYDLGFADEEETALEDSDDQELSPEEESFCNSLGLLLEEQGNDATEILEMAYAVQEQKEKTQKALDAYYAFIAGKEVADNSKEEIKSERVANSTASVFEKLHEELASQIRNAYMTIQHAHFAIWAEQEADNALKALQEAEKDLGF